MFTLRRRSLFQKYFLVLFIAASVPLLASGLSDAWLSYRDQRTLLNSLLGNEAKAAAERIEGFLNGVRSELGWAVQQPWTAGNEEQHRLLELAHVVASGSRQLLPVLDEGFGIGGRAGKSRPLSACGFRGRGHGKVCWRS